MAYVYTLYACSKLPDVGQGDNEVVVILDRGDVDEVMVILGRGGVDEFFSVECVEDV
ncbi:hypothetical protein C1645_835829 [Glomus cerebriforme]|uniref:Uncharacterized protein n=1 Tax=Glomus cerebriforme TaxID=658196 RepID=A0A397S856_9GLOM|nr:hypothetical protein C1645_835829 [Glomus cerebriforme]